MNPLNEILTKKVADIEKSRLIEEILLKNNYRCFVEIDSEYIRIEELEEPNKLDKNKIKEILKVKTVKKASYTTIIGRYNIFYIPIFFSHIF